MRYSYTRETERHRVMGCTAKKKETARRKREHFSTPMALHSICRPSVRPAARTFGPRNCRIFRFYVVRLYELIRFLFRGSNWASFCAAVLRPRSIGWLVLLVGIDGTRSWYERPSHGVVWFSFVNWYRRLQQLSLFLLVTCAAPIFFPTQLQNVKNSIANKIASKTT